MDDGEVEAFAEFAGKGGFSGAAGADDEDALHWSW